MSTLTGLIPTVYKAMDKVARELTGFIPAVTIDADAAERVAVGQAVRSFVAPAASAADLSPGTNPPDTGDQTFSYIDVTITKARGVPFRWTGEEDRGVRSGPGRQAMQVDQIAQAIRTLTNEVEADLGVCAYQGASRAYGTVGTTPFASTVGDSAQIAKILSDNGCPSADRQLVIDTTIGAALKTLGQLSKVNESGDSGLLRQGILGDLHGLAIRESAGVASHTKGTAANATTGAAGYSVGATSIATAAAGTGNIVAGDLITFAGDSNQYVVVTGKTDVGTGTTAIEIAKPGLRQAIPASATNITVVGTGYRSAAFHRSSIVLVARPPAVPEEGDMASDALLITDPYSGLTFELRLYKQYRRVKYELALAWGVKHVKSEFGAILLR